MAPFGVERYFGEQGYDYEEIILEGFMEWEEGEDDEDAGLPQPEVHLGRLRDTVSLPARRGRSRLGESGSLHIPAYGVRGPL